MNYRQAWAPDARFDIFRIGLSGIVDNQACHLIDGYSRPIPRKLGHRFTHRLFQKSDRHAPGGHPITQAALQRAKVPVDLVRSAQGVDWFDRLWRERPIRLDFA